MSLRDATLQTALDAAFNVEQRVPKLRRELHDIEQRKRQIETELAAANRAQLRLASYRERALSKPELCGFCWINSETESVFESIGRPPDLGTDSAAAGLDFFRCRSCKAVIFSPP
jgi:hypothetical protein